MKVAWKKPGLLVLSRGTPDEVVLVNCKTGRIGGSGPGNKVEYCENRLCENCSAIGWS